MENYSVTLIVIVLFVLIILSSAIRILREYERGVIFRLGRLIGGDGIKGPGFILLIPVVDKMVKVSLRTVSDAPQSAEKSPSIVIIHTKILAGCLDSSIPSGTELRVS